MTYLIRKLKNTDVGDVYAIERDNFPVPWSLENIQDEIIGFRPYALPVGVFWDQKLVAYCFSWWVAGEIHLLNLSVKKEFQGKGVGRWLLSSLLNKARGNGYKRTLLEVAENNPRAIALYESLGFVKVAIRMRYYHDNTDAILMNLEFQPNGAPIQAPAPRAGGEEAQGQKAEDQKAEDQKAQGQKPKDQKPAAAQDPTAPKPGGGKGTPGGGPEGS